MKKSGFVIIILSVLIFSSTFVLAGENQNVQGDPQKGALYFSDAEFAGSTNQMSCNSCHPKGKGLFGVAEKEEYKKSGDVNNALAKIVNQCIKQALKGTPLNPGSAEMLDMVAYLKTLTK